MKKRRSQCIILFATCTPTIGKPKFINSRTFYPIKNYGTVDSTIAATDGIVKRIDSTNVQSSKMNLLTSEIRGLIAVNLYYSNPIDFSSTYIGIVTLGTASTVIVAVAIVAINRTVSAITAVLSSTLGTCKTSTEVKAK